VEGRWDVDREDPRLPWIFSMLHKVAEAAAERQMQIIEGTLRVNRMAPGVSVGPHDDGRITDDDLTVIMFDKAPDAGGEFVVSLKPEHRVIIVLPSAATHEVYEILSGTRESIMAGFTHV
jgi:hypothetical protein